MKEFAYGIGKSCLIFFPKTQQTVFITDGCLVLADSSFFLKRGPELENRAFTGQEWRQNSMSKAVQNVPVLFFTQARAAHFAFKNII